MLGVFLGGEHGIFDFQSKLGCTSKIKINTNLFGILLGLDKFLTIKNENTFSFSLLNRNFALTLKRKTERMVSKKMKSEKLKSVLKEVGQFCSYLFGPQRRPKDISGCTRVHI